MAAWASKLVLASPSPTQTEPSCGLVRSAPIAIRGSPVDQRCQVTPRSVDFHTPPSAPPAKTAPRDDARAVIRPETTPQPTPQLENPSGP